MSWLTGREVQRQVTAGRIRIDPFHAEQCNPNSYDYRLGDFLRILECNSVHQGIACIDPRKPMTYREVPIPSTGYLLEVEKAYLGSTMEKFGSDHYAALVTGKSSIGRLFVKNHACAGLIDQGFFNHITLEITAKIPTLIFPGMRFGQIFWFESVGECDLYRGKYALQSNAARPSAIHLDMEE
jgi:dCTP deaminase